jgi:dTDP-4-dehydrorhamnose 3,5-epimerase
MDSLSIDGVWVWTPPIHRDGRGSFLEVFRADELAAAAGRALEVAQVNCSVSRCGVIRGIHFADVPPGQAKYVTCLTGAVLDVVVDLRAGSPGFGQSETVRLDAQTGRAVFIPEGLGHGFMALSDQACVAYLCSAPYAPGREHSVHPLDPDIGIDWPRGGQPILSEKDAAAPSLREALDGGLLPAYAECVRYAAEFSADGRAG